MRERNAARHSDVPQPAIRTQGNYPQLPHHWQMMNRGEKWIPWRRRRRWFLFLLYLCACAPPLCVQGLKISPKACSNALGDEGTCMFVWECIKTEGKHLGTCTDGFLYGSCCSHRDEITPSETPSVNSIVDSPPPPKPHRPPPSHFTSSSTTALTTTTVRPKNFTLIYLTGGTTTKRPTTVILQRPVVLQQTRWPPTFRPPLTTFWSLFRPQPTVSLFTQRPIIVARPTTSSTIQVKPPVPVVSVVPAVASTSFQSLSQTAPMISSTTKKPEIITKAKVSCGIAPLTPQKKVVGGKSSSFGSWPWQVSVRRTSFFGFSSTHRCGGAILNKNWIATAGHCVDDLLLSQIRVRVGEYDFSSALEPYPYIERSAKKKVVHPKYNFFTYENDLALVKLDQPLEYMPHIAPICLPPDDEPEDLIGRNATVTGWGRLSEGGVLPSVLQEVQVPIVSNDKCKNMFMAAGRNEYIPNIFMCAGFSEGGKDSCQGDSGGPLQVQDKKGQYFLAGIISWGIGCASPNLPGVCTRISRFKDWMEKIMATN